MSFNVEEFINRFKDRANAVKDRPMPPIGGDERMQFMKQAELDYCLLYTSDAADDS